jgi:DnaJ-domain-containing protein 1
MQEYHPDKVSHLGEELQEVAHRKTLEIQRAYERLRQP